MSVYLHGLATALPKHRLNQAEVRERASVIFSEKYPQFDRLAKTFDTAGALLHKSSFGWTTPYPRRI